MISQENIYKLISEERLRQNKKWGAGDWLKRAGGGNTPPSSKYLVLAEEVGEVAEAILKKDSENLFEELVQVAAVAVKWLETFDLSEEWDNGGVY